MIESIYHRHSVRKFQDTEVKKEDIIKMLDAAAQAPSAKNVQNWHFVVVQNKDVMSKLADIVAEKNARVAETIEDEGERTKWTKFLRFGTFFKDAPVTVLVYAGPCEGTGYEEMKQGGFDREEVDQIERSAQGIQGVGAAIQNFCLTAWELGYGTCWMTSPVYAAKEIEAYLPVGKDGFELVAILPLGVPDGEIKFPGRNSYETFTTFVD